MFLHILLAGTDVTAHLLASTNVTAHFIGWYKCDRKFFWLVQILLHILLTVQLLLHILLVGAELDPRDSLVATLPKLSVMAGLGLPSHRMSNVSMLKHPRTSTFGNSQLSGIKPFVIAS